MARRAMGGQEAVESSREHYEAMGNGETGRESCALEQCCNSGHWSLRSKAFRSIFTLTLNCDLFVNNS